MTTLTFKDFIPLIGTLLTVIMGYRLISVQINKNRKAKWIDDFRKEIANFFSLAVSMNKEFSVEKGYQMLNCTSVLLLYLFDSKEYPRRELVKKIREFQSMSMKKGNVETVEDVEMFGQKLGEIMKLASETILIEQNKI
jgi:phosphorylcholine metabolism protein LicD